MTRRGMESGGRKITLHDVAVAAGVTMGTASKALNGSGKLRQETRERVRAEARKLGFRLSGQDGEEQMSIVLLTTDYNGRFSLPFLAGLEQAVRDYALPVTVVLSRAETAEQARAQFALFRSKRVQGMIFLADNANLHTPLVTFEPQDLPFLYAYAHTADTEALVLRPDDEQGGRRATEYLLSLGRREIAHITGPLYFDAVHMRARGMRQALLARDVPFSEMRMLSGPWSQSWGYEAVQQLWARDSGIDAIFCGNDEIACGVINALQEKGIDVPEQVSVIGFDNYDVMVHRTRPSLTTIDMNLPELGRVAGTYLLEMIGGKEVKRGVVCLPCSLVERGTCAQIR